MQPQKLGGGFWARVLPKRAGHRAITSGTEDPGGLPDKGGGQEGGGGRAPLGWRRSWDRGEEGAVPGPHRHVPRPPWDPRPPTTVSTRLTWAARHAADGAASRRVGVGPRPIAWWPPQSGGASGALSAGSRESTGGGVPPLSLPGRGAPPPPPGGAPPRLHHLGEPRLCSRGKDRVSRNRSPPISSRPHGLWVAPPLPARDPRPRPRPPHTHAV